jgi:hypothetical protein
LPPDWHCSPQILIWTIFLSQTVKKLSMSLKAIKNTKKMTIICQ